jgi:hypothetical protein
LLLGSSPAAAVPIGTLSFDTLIPGPDGVNAFTLGNFTGAFSLDPDFPVTDSLILVGSTLALTVDGGATTSIPLGDIGPGFVAVEFADSIAFNAATLTATLGSLEFLLPDGSTFQAASAAISLVLLPSVGSILSSGDLAVLDIERAAPVGVPEPGTLLMFGSGVLVCVSVRRRRMTRL